MEHQKGSSGCLQYAMCSGATATDEKTQCKLGVGAGRVVCARQGSGLLVRMLLYAIHTGWSASQPSRINLPYTPDATAANTYEIKCDGK